MAKYFMCLQLNVMNQRNAENNPLYVELESIRRENRRLSYKLNRNERTINIMQDQLDIERMQNQSFMGNTDRNQLSNRQYGISPRNHNVLNSQRFSNVNSIQ